MKIIGRSVVRCIRMESKHRDDPDLIRSDNPTLSGRVREGWRDRSTVGMDR